MTRGEAIQVLQTALTAPFIYGEYADAIGMAIEALQAKTEGDLISREEVLRTIITAGECEPDLGYTHLHTVIESLPSRLTEYKTFCGVPIEEAARIVQEYNADKPTGDLIRRQDAVNALEERLRANGYSNVALVSELNRSIGYLMRLPSVDRPTGEWEEVPHKSVKHGEVIIDGQTVRCSVCRHAGKGWHKGMNFCPNCGARNER